MTGPFGAIDRTDVADYVDTLFLIYFVLIFVRILLTWIPRIPHNPVLQALVGFVRDVTDPYLRLFRRFLPPVGGGGFALDLSPIVGILVLLILRGLVVGAIAP